MIEVAPSAPIETVTPIRPSEAIRLGCLTTGPGFGALVMQGASGWLACAYGAMAVGYGFVPGQTDGRTIVDFLPRDLHTDDACPACGGATYELVTHLNDSHQWTRERIADWLESRGL